MRKAIVTGVVLAVLAGVGTGLHALLPPQATAGQAQQELEVNQDVLGRGGSRVVQDHRLEVWVMPLADGTKAVALFNRGLQAADVHGAVLVKVGRTK